MTRFSYQDVTMFKILVETMNGLWLELYVNNTLTMEMRSVILLDLVVKTEYIHGIVKAKK